MGVCTPVKTPMYLYPLLVVAANDVAANALQPNHDPCECLKLHLLSRSCCKPNELDPGCVHYQ